MRICTQGFPILCTLRAVGAHKVFIVAVFAGSACKNSNNKCKLPCEAEQNARKKENWNALICTGGGRVGHRYYPFFLFAIIDTFF